jgi:hypothetical protein
MVMCIRECDCCNRFDVVVCVRFLERALLPRLKSFLKPGGSHLSVMDAQEFVLLCLVLQDDASSELCNLNCHIAPMVGQSTLLWSFSMKHHA